MPLRLIPKTEIDFVGRSGLYLFLLLSVILVGSLIIFLRGFNLGLDFTGGTFLQLKFDKPQDISLLRKIIQKNGIEVRIRTYEGNSFGFFVKGKQDNVNEYAQKIITSIENEGIRFIEEKREYVGPVVGRELAKKALFAILLSMFGIIVYIAFRFSNPIWGISGVIALLHDVFVAIVALIIVGGEIDLVIVAALLTIAGYSINDTIVIYDRIRENLKKFPKLELGKLINISINETLSRTIITSVTVFMVLLVLYLWGGSSIKDFAFCMLVGTISGVYSTITIATSLAYRWQKEK